MMNKAQRVTALTVLRDAIDAELNTARAELHSELLDLQQRHSVKTIDVNYGAETVAQATLSERRAAIINDHEEWIAWVAENYPDWCYTQIVVDSLWQKEFLKSLEEYDNGVAVDKSTGVFVDGVTFPQATKVLTVRFKPEGRNKVAWLFRTGVTSLEDLLPDTPLKEITE